MSFLNDFIKHRVTTGNLIIESQNEDVADIESMPSEHDAALSDCSSQIKVTSSDSLSTNPSTPGDSPIVVESVSIPHITQSGSTSSSSSSSTLPM